MIFFMALLGAITRLTGSGLSITDWDPIMGALPPLSDAAWNKAFQGYQQIPQYQVFNHGMTLDAFKGIYFWEWLHRFWGRLIGFAFGVPLVIFFIRRKIDRKLFLRLAMIFAFGALQGFIGWFMVESGLAVRTSVSPYRLALHLGFALLIYAIILWTGLDRWRETEPAHVVKRSAARHGWIALGFLVVTMTWGAFAAGLHAGEAYNTWPLMEGDVLPSAAFTLLPKWLNVFENLAFVQFIHRWLGPTTMLVILAWVFRAWRLADKKSKRMIFALGAMAFLQVALGLATLLAHAEIVLAVLHQAGAIALLTLLLINLHMIQSQRGQNTEQRLKGF
jgi:cytochrome c oxidase assembly protein subunit 15